jgi:hypothetical protein
MHLVDLSDFTRKIDALSQTYKTLSKRILNLITARFIRALKT